MTNITAWATSAVKRFIGTFVLVATTTYLGLAGVEAAGVIEVGAGEASLLTDPHLILAALSVGLSTAIAEVLVPTLTKAAQKLRSTDEVELEI